MTTEPTEQTSREMLRYYAGALRRSWWIILLTVVLAVDVAAYVTARQDSVYRSSMKIVVGQDRALFAPEFGNAVEPFTQTMTDLVESDIVARQTIRDLRLDITPTELTDRLHVDSNPRAAVLEVTYDDTDRARGRRVLARLGEVFTRLVNERLGTADGRDREVLASASVFDPAHMEPGRVAPHPVRNAVIAGVLGLIAGIGLALLRDALSRRIHGRSEAEDAFDASVVGVLPPGVRGGTPPEVGGRIRPRRARELIDALSILRANVQFSKTRGEGVLLVTSALPEEGKTTVVAHLGAALAIAGHSVVAVEGDMRRPALHRYLGTEPGHAGLAELLDGEIPVDQALVPIPAKPVIPELFIDGSARLRRLPRRRHAGAAPAVSGNGRPPDRLFLLPCGRRDVDPGEKLSRERLDPVIAALRDVADYVLIDSPALLVVGDAFPLAQLADHVLVVAREGQTSRDEGELVCAALEELGVRDFSIVLSDSRARRREGYYAYGPVT